MTAPKEQCRHDPATDTLYTAMFKDKKMAAGKLRFIVANKIGKASVVTDVSETLVKEAWNAARAGSTH